MANFALSVSQASGSKFKSNKNGKLPLVLACLNGNLPTNSGILDGSLAERLGIQVGKQYVIGISFRGYHNEEEFGKKYPNYDYVMVTKLGAGFEQLVAAQVVASMNFGFVGGTPTPTPTPVAQPTPEEETPEEEEA